MEEAEVGLKLADGVDGNLLDTGMLLLETQALFLRVDDQLDGLIFGVDIRVELAVALS